ncbi:hypothetical protein CFC21_060591 [Triticum aestivum]|uniref:Uncharacterized protein n=2 Tax=Triticum aestivum TaxID=4565 RepID=A0A9R1GT00_WHEAT|nr:hypothetical protein CFC21_060591 [Triticum aestivum]
MAIIIFLDSPVCSGFSYARDPKGCDVTDYLSSLQVQRFLNKWFTDHPQYLSNPFYLGGDSFSIKDISLNRYIEGKEECRILMMFLLFCVNAIYFQGYLIGNPITDPKFDNNFQVQGAHGFGIISDQIYEAAMKNCKGNYVNPANQLCAEVLETVDSVRFMCWHFFRELMLFSTWANEHPFCYSSFLKSQMHTSCTKNTYDYYLAYFWMNNKMTREALEIKGGTVGEWVRCKKELPYTQDMPSSIPYHLNPTTRGYRALVYSGDHDLQVPQLSTQAWIRSLNFSIADDWRAWHLDGQAAGFTITYANKLTFATVKGGGHTAPEYQSEECFAMAQRWLDNKPL